MYAVPRPSFPWRCSTWTRGSCWARPSASCPVPSGEASSTTSTSSRESCANTCGTSCGRLAASLYVGMTTSARSATPARPPQPHSGAGPCGQEQQRDDRHELAPREGRRRELQLYPLCPGFYGHREERLITPPRRRRLSIDGRMPVGIPVLGDQQITVLWWCGIEGDRHPSRRPVRERGPRRAAVGHFGHRERIDRLGLVEEDDAAEIEPRIDQCGDDSVAVDLCGGGDDAE